MNRNLSNTDDRAGNPRLLWAAIILVGAVFFYVGHDFQVSRFFDYAPWSDSDGSLESGGNMTKGLALAMLGLFGLYLLLRRDGRPLRLGGWLPALMGFYLAWAAASVLWSEDPGLSCRRLAVIMFCVLAALGFVRQFRPRDIVLIAVAVPAAYLFVGVAAEISLGTFRPWAADYRFAGTVHPNTQGVHLTILCLGTFCLARFSRDDNSPRRLFWTLFAVGLVFLILTKSRTSCAALLVSLAALWLITHAGRIRLLAIIAVGFIVCSTALFSLMFDLRIGESAADVALLGRSEESSKLTGRVPVWKELSAYIAERPLQGYGYGAFWTHDHIEAVSEEMQWALREAHNGYIDSLLGVGLIGTAALVLGLLLGICRAAQTFRSTADPEAAMAVCLLVFAAFNSFLESGFITPNFVTLLTGCCVLQLLSYVGDRFAISRLGATNGRGFTIFGLGATDGRGFVK